MAYGKKRVVAGHKVVLHRNSGRTGQTIGKMLAKYDPKTGKLKSPTK
jgi:hypothetical protein